MENSLRSKFHKKDTGVEETLSELDSILKEPNSKALPENHMTELPTIYIVGCARSGSTLLFQRLCKHLDVCYPSNFLSRFHYAPYIGAKIQYLLSDLDFKKENLGAFPPFSLSSKLGKTQGPLAPHEFWYYWRNIFGVDEFGYIKNISESSLREFHKGLEAIKSVFQKPLVLKGMIANNSISNIIRPNDIVIHIKRDTAFNAQSLLNARQSFFGNRSEWYSFKIPDYVIPKSTFKQVIDQVRLTNQLIQKEIQELNDNQVISISYENLVTDFPSLRENLLKEANFVSKEELSLEEIKIQDKVTLSEIEWNELQKYL